jgi:hypothetical protein
MIKAGNFAHASGDLGRLFFDLPDLWAMLLHQREGNQRHHAISRRRCTSRPASK